MSRSILIGCLAAVGCGAPAGDSDVAAGTSVFTVSPAAPTTLDDLTALLDGRPQHQTQWQKDGVFTGFTGATLPNALTTRGETWRAIWAAGEVHFEASAVIGDTAPICDAATVEASAEGLQCKCTARVDPDVDDPVADMCAFVVGGVAVDTKGACDLPASAVAPGQGVACVSEPGDGTLTGAAVSSPTITVAGREPDAPLEDAGADYVDVARGPDGVRTMMRFIKGVETGFLPLAPPFVRVDGQVISQTANILHVLAPRLGLAPADEAGRARALAIMLTVADLCDEAHDVHHPIASSLYYADQQIEAARRAPYFVRERIPKYLGWLERLLERDGHLVTRETTYVDLAAFQVIEGLRYAFPNAMRGAEAALPRLVTLHDRVAARPRLAAYLASERRVAASTNDLFRHYPELDP